MVETAPCPTCGLRLPRNFHFCPGCGAALSETAGGDGPRRSALDQLLEARLRAQRSQPVQAAETTWPRQQVRFEATRASTANRPVAPLVLTVCAAVGLLVLVGLSAGWVLGGHVRGVRALALPGVTRPANIARKTAAAPGRGATPNAWDRPAPPGSLLAAIDDGSVNRLPATGDLPAAIAMAKDIRQNARALLQLASPVAAALQAQPAWLSRPVSAGDMGQRQQFVSEAQALSDGIRHAAADWTALGSARPPCLLPLAQPWEQHIHEDNITVDWVKGGVQSGLLPSEDRLSAVEALPAFYSQTLDSLAGVRLADCLASPSPSPSQEFGHD